MANEIKVFADKEAMSQAFVDKLASLALSPLKVALSGGSTPKRAYELLYKSEIDRSKLNLYMVDERYVPITDERSNERIMREALHLEEGFAFHPMYREGGPQAAAEAYDQLLRKEVDRFDVVLLGMGPDGHTASIFPNMWPEIPTPDTWCVASKAPVVCEDRITLTPRAIIQAEQTIFMIAGPDKIEALKQVLTPTPDESLPAKYIARQTPHCEIWLDQPTADLL